MERGSSKHEHPGLADLVKKERERKGRGRRSRRGERPTGRAKAAPMTSSATSLNLSPGVTGRCSAFSVIMTDLLSSYCSSIMLLWAIIDLKTVTLFHATAGSNSPRSEGACCMTSFNVSLDVLIWLSSNIVEKCLSADMVFISLCHAPALRRMWSSDRPTIYSWWPIMS